MSTEIKCVVEKVTITLWFDYKLIGVVNDKFGEGPKMICLNDNTCVATVKVQISPVFCGWIFQFENQMRINFPSAK